MIVKRLIWVRAGNRGNLGNIFKGFLHFECQKNRGLLNSSVGCKIS